jgi:triacylglycerol lipase
MDVKAADDCCATRWPLLLVHGVGFHDSRRYRYWGRIPEALVAHGARVHYGLQDAWGSCEDNAYMLRETLLSIVAQTGCEKVNVIAHSKGGLDTRALVSMGDCAPHVASITTIATPHAGSRAMDAIMRIPPPLFKAVAVPVNGIFRLLGDDTPDFYAVCSQMTTSAMRHFNEEHPLVESLFCQSYAGVMDGPMSDVTMALTYLFVRHFDGPNDGLVALSSTPFGRFNGVIEGAGPRGVSHCDAVDLRRRALKKRPRRGLGRSRGGVGESAGASGSENGGGGVSEVPEASDLRFDIVDWHLRLVADLKARGL